ncbi:MAG TPA: ABC transporter permease [Blastocatellia bacterium]|nr:ABC transporter permease [Blastocatellia bacterium]
MENFLKDIRFGLRVLMKDKVLTIVAILALAIGTGANTAIFSVVNAVLLRPLPYNEPDRLIVMWGTNVNKGMTTSPVSILDFKDYRDRNNTLEAMASYSYDDFNISRGDVPERIQGAFVSANFFNVLGVKQALGNNFASNADQAGAERVAIISDGLWKRRFAASKEVIGEDLMINGANYKVIGVMGPEFRAPAPYDEKLADDDIWIPMSFDISDPARLPSVITPDRLKTEAGQRKWSFLQIIGRLKPNVPINQAEADLTNIAGQLERDFQATNRGRSVRLVPLHQQIVGNMKPAFVLLLVAVGLVLLIACANVANLLLARAARRQKEIAIRVALGAGRARLIRQLLTESVMLGVAGGALGLAVAFAGIKLLIALNPPKLPRLDEIGIDGFVLLFTLLISVLTGIIFGLVPALQASKPNLNETLKEGGRGSTAGGAARRIRTFIVVSEVALTTVLLIGAALMLKSFLSLQKVDPGFNSDRVLTMQMTLPLLKYSTVDEETGAYEPDAKRMIQFYDAALERIQQNRNEVQAAGLINIIPLTEGKTETSFNIEGRESPDETYSANASTISENYFEAMGIRILEGRAFDQRDRIERKEESEGSEAPLTVIINKGMAERFWPGQSAIDKRIVLPGDPPKRLRIVGVVADVKTSKLSEDAPNSQIYVPYFQSDEPDRYTALIVRTKTDPEAATATVRKAIQDVDPFQPVYFVKTLDTIVSESISQPRLYMALLAIFAGIALVLAAIGIYGVMSYSVTQRTHEIGIRMALGAQGGDILKMVIRQGMTLAIAGTIIGAAAALALGAMSASMWPGFTSSLLFGVSAIDLGTYIVIPLVLAAIALVSISIPALRATKVDPMVALRYE